MTENYFSELSKYMAESRKKKGLTQAELAAKLGYRSSTMIGNWESGITSPPLYLLRQVILELDLNLDEIVGCILFGSQRIQNRPKH